MKALRDLFARRPDLKLHLGAGFAAGVVAAAIGAVLGLPGGWLFVFSVGGAGVAGFLKEAYDHATGRGTPAWDDFWWTVLGGLLAGVLALPF